MRVGWVGYVCEEKKPPNDEDEDRVIDRYRSEREDASRPKTETWKE
jgi:hypothetical protein